ncbi:MAG: hypothetical protein Q9169_006002 [Polycauliona sp. 2 TL-2023]
MPPFTLNPNLFNRSLYSRLLNLWLSDLPLTASAATPPLTSKWFGGPPSVDTECTSTALPALESLSPEKYPLPPLINKDHDHENYPAIARPFLSQFANPSTSGGDEGKTENEEAALGLILLLDQMPRNIFRSQQSLIYTHYDRISRAVAYAIYDSSIDTCTRYRASPPYRLWFYMPLMHSESLADHVLFAKKLEDMEAIAEGNEEAKEYLGTLGAFEGRHKVLIDKFGRYPHRNRVMGREETEEEKECLANGGDTFGAG